MSQSIVDSLARSRRNTLLGSVSGTSNASLANSVSMRQSFSHLDDLVEEWQTLTKTNKEEMRKS